MTTCWIDLETRNARPLTEGGYRYAIDCEITLRALAIDDSEVVVDEWSEQVARGLQLDIDAAHRVIAHNSEFDFTVLAAHGVHIPMEKRYCTLAQARRHGLPGGLDKLCEIFRLPQDKAKHKEGRALVMLFCKPRPDGAWATKETHPAEWARYVAYAGGDVIAMRELHRLMPKWNDEIELPIWRLDQQINARGFCVDVELAQASVQLLGRNAGRLDEAISDQTGGAVERGSQRDRLLEYLFDELGVALPDLQASTLERRLADPDIPEGVKELLRLRQQSSKTSTAKYGALLKLVSPDGRLRGSLAYCGAGRTGRWAGRGFQPQNLPRPKFPAVRIDQAIGEIKAGVLDLVEDTEVSNLCAAAIRGCITAGPGKRLFVSDLANIEGRVVAWLAGEKWKLDAFGAYDAGTGPDLYKLAYARAFNVDPETVDKDQRQVGKVMELMLGYGGGVGAFITGAKTYRVGLQAMAPRAWPGIPRDVQIEAEKMWARTQEDPKRFPHYGLAREVYLACDGLKRLWRRAHPKIEQLWYVSEDAGKAAATQRDPQIEYPAGKVRFDRSGSWLRMRLPSGRFLCYPAPRVSDAGDLTFMGQSPYTRTWARQKTWGGTLVENATQAMARDVLAGWMVNLEASGFQTVLTVHDEVLCELPQGGFPREPATLLPVIPGLPLTAKGFDDVRYRKDD